MEKEKTREIQKELRKKMNLKEIDFNLKISG